MKYNSSFYNTNNFDTWDSPSNNSRKNKSYAQIMLQKRKNNMNNNYSCSAFSKKKINQNFLKEVITPQPKFAVNPNINEANLTYNPNNTLKGFKNAIKNITVKQNYNNSAKNNKIEFLDNIANKNKPLFSYHNVENMIGENNLDECNNTNNTNTNNIHTSNYYFSPLSKRTKSVNKQSSSSYRNNNFRNNNKNSSSNNINSKILNNSFYRGSITTIPNKINPNLGTSNYDSICTNIIGDNTINANISNNSRKAKSKEKKIVNLSDSVNNMFLIDATECGTLFLNNHKLNKSITPQTAYFETNNNLKRYNQNNKQNNRSYSISKLNTSKYNNSPSLSELQTAKLKSFDYNEEYENSDRNSINTNNNNSKSNIVNKLTKGEFSTYHNSNDEIRNKSTEIRYKSNLRDYAYLNNLQGVDFQNMYGLFNKKELNSINHNNHINNQEQNDYDYSYNNQDKHKAFTDLDNIYQTNKDNPHLLSNLVNIHLSFVGNNALKHYLSCLEESCNQLEILWDHIDCITKVENFLELTSSKNKKTVKVGALVALYLLIKNNLYNENKLSNEIKGIVFDKALELILEYESHEELFLTACLEILSLFTRTKIINNDNNEEENNSKYTCFNERGDNQQDINFNDYIFPREITTLMSRINLISLFLTDFNYPILQKSSFNLLMNLNHPGISALIEIASKEYKDIQEYILKNLIETPYIQRNIIVKALVNDLFNEDINKRHISLAALNRMNEIIDDDEVLEILRKLASNQNKIEKLFICSTLRSAGIKGERILIEELNKTNDFGLKVAIITSLSHRINIKKSYLKVKLHDKNENYGNYSSSNTIITSSYNKTSSNYNNKYCKLSSLQLDEKPGVFYSYYGEVRPISSIVFPNKDNALLKEDEFNSLAYDAMNVDIKTSNANKNKSKDINLKDYHNSRDQDNQINFNKINKSSNKKQDLLIIYPKDLLSSLQRFITLNANFTSPILVNTTISKVINNTSLLSEKEIGKLLNNDLNEFNILDHLDIQHNDNSTFSKYKEFFCNVNRKDLSSNNSLYYNNEHNNYNNYDDCYKNDYNLNYNYKDQIDNLSEEKIKELGISKSRFCFNYNSNNNSENNSILGNKNKGNLKLHPSNSGDLLLSKESIKAITSCFNSYSSPLKETACSLLGNICLPESLLSVGALIQLLKDEDQTVKYRAIWCLGRLSQGLNIHVIQKIVDCLIEPHTSWKLKTACLLSISEFGEKACSLALPHLLKLLKEGSMYKQFISETIIKLGHVAESSLLKILSKEKDRDNTRLKSSIYSSFAICNIHSPNIDFIVESIYKGIESEFLSIKKSAILTLKILVDKADDTVTLLKKENTLPLFYNKLSDKDSEIQQVSVLINLNFL